jgi:TonB-linked SusC/RagA family outer membrane protein
MNYAWRRLLAGTLVVSAPAVVVAQPATTISGIVQSDAGAPIQGASVALPSLGLGSLTDADGRYRFVVPPNRATGTTSLSVRRLGFQPKTQMVTLGAGPVSANFALIPTVNQLEGVVVSALGVTKEKSQLGTAQTQISAEELNTTYDRNIVNQLSGKVAGVQITGAGTQGGSSQIRIRGMTSLTGNNSPLFIVDGTPISTESRGGDPNGGGNPRGADYGSAIQDINPDDISSMTVLKGPNAAALYGSRAANGVIVITTKKGTAGRVGLQVSSSVTYDKASILPDYQNLYGQGSAGEFDFVDGAGGGVQDGNDQSFGPRLDGRTTGCVFKAGTTTYDTSAPCRQFTAPNGGPWVAHPDNVESFFKGGRTVNTNVAFSGGTDKATARVSIGGENTDGIIPNSFLRRITTLANGQLSVNDRLTSTGSLSYVRNAGRNRPGTGYNNGILEQFIWFGRQVDMNALKNYKNEDGSEFNWNYNYHNNPFWQQYENPQSDSRDRVIASGEIRYKFADWLNGTLRSGVDNYRFGIDANFAKGNLNFSDLSYNGAFQLVRDTYNEVNTDAILNASHTLGSHLWVSAMVGGSKRNLRRTSESVTVSGLSVEGIYNVSNAAVAPSVGQSANKSLINAAYASASFTFNNWWTVEGTARNDWSSTLPKGENSYFYPSLNTSIVLTDAIPAIKSRVLDYAKIRGAVARVGADANPYALATTYSGSSSQFGGRPLFSLGNVLSNSQLKPELTSSREVGAELGFFGGRMTLDASMYHKYTRDQIINIVVSSTSGFTSKAINAGELSNHGFEALLSTTPVKMRDFEWNSSFNYTHNKGKVTELYPGLQTITLGGTWSATVEARVGEAYGTIRGYKIKKDSSGNWLLAGGLPQRDPAGLQVLGNVQPKWIGGFSNSFRYKKLTLNTLLDMHIGGSIYSVSNMFGEYTGVFANTTMGREVDWNKPGVVVKGIDEASRKANTTTVTSEDYFQSFFRLHERYVYDDSWYKLREVRIGYDLPKAFAQRVYAAQANIALIGRNLWTSSDIPNIDPEFSYTTGNYQGQEFAALPSARSIGVSVRLTP